MGTWCINSEKIIVKNDFPYHFKKIIVRYKKISFNVDVLRQTACLVVNHIKVNSFAIVLGWAHCGLTGGFLLSLFTIHVKMTFDLIQ